MTGKRLELEPSLEEYRQMFMELGYTTSPDWAISRIQRNVELFKTDPKSFLISVEDRIGNLKPRTKEIVFHIISFKGEN